MSADNADGVGGRPQLVEIHFGRLRQEVGWWLDAQARQGYGPELAPARLARDANFSVRGVRRLLAGERCSLGTAERLLDAIDYRDTARRHPDTGRVLPLVIRSRFAVDGRSRQPGETGRIKTVDFANAKLNERQLRAIYKLHVDGGFSLREICRQGYTLWGYSSAKSALTCVSSRLRSIGLMPRDVRKATALSNKMRAGTLGEDLDRAALRRRSRASRRANDPSYRAHELRRLAELHEREAAARRRSPSPATAPAEPTR